MALRIVKLPDIGEGVAEAEIVEWHVSVGDTVGEDQILAAVMTDKATVEIPTPCAGTVVALGGAAGETLAVGGELVRLEVEGTDAAAPSAPSAPAAPTATDGAVPPSPSPAPPHRAPAAPAAPRRTTSPASPAPRLGAPRAPGEKPLASPAVRLRAREAGVDLRQVRGSGPAGRISHEDLDLFLRGGPALARPGAPVPNEAVEEIAVTGLRRRIAANMAEATRRVAHFSYVEEVDVTALEALRKALNARDPARGRLTLLPFLMTAMARAVADHPQLNAHYDDEANVLRRYGAAHIGVATQTPAGLMVPVVRHAEARDLWDLSAEIARLAQAARDGLAAAADLSGSTITLSSLGALGGIVSTPVVNRPEVAIVGVNRQVMRPVWDGATFVPRLTMNLSSSFDHRIVDGADAAGFVQRIKGLLEEPATLFV
ncbi:dihydrolipoamide acetyltransferase family protein [Aurantimonas sp. Leaf443]|uniref:dihydrolipoamide acetyltransferase family protein n=1 Tax=Aurantimonas sp. Leaf443 TaxID=1736378 RepID=UPI0006FC39ED|nr:dihydrolipoamide acetyltransferase family protein [Aurantimonas sp. Leaf443]KQT84119.1 branched-chain alpha-keto acid dehydrogenase subunit E2 [Aurantimonas sp. Leaf443]